MRFNTHEEFVDYCKITYNNDFKYMSEYIGTKYKITIKCKYDHIFEQQAGYHLRFGRCPECWKIKLKEGFVIDHKSFLEKLIKKHGAKYTLLEKYVDCYTHIKFLCNDCKNEFLLDPAHILPRGCPHCRTKEARTKITKSNEDYIKQGTELHCGEYEYIGEYINSYTRIEIKHLNCNRVFMQSPKVHLRGGGCSYCHESHGEVNIRHILDKYKINFISQKSFPDCRGKRYPIPFDFYLTDYNKCIEYQGEQHYRPIRLKNISTEEAIRVHERTKINDLIKKQYCEDKSIDLMAIPFTEFNQLEKIIKFRLNI